MIQPDVASVTILERMTDAFFALDAAWRFTYLNAAAEVALGQQRADLLGRNVWEAFPEAVGSTFQREYERARATGQLALFKEYYSPLAKLFAVRAYPDADGLAVFFQDVTAQRQLTEQETALRDAAATQARLLDAVLDALPTGVAITRADGSGVRLNRAFRTIWGMDAPLPANTAEYGLYRGWWPNGQPIAADAWTMARALATGQPITDELITIMSFDGVRKVILNSALPLFDATGALIGGVNVMLDVTREQRLQEDLAARVQQLEGIFAAITDALLIYDAQGRIIETNPVARALLGINDQAEYEALPLMERAMARAARDLEGNPLPPDQLPPQRLLHGEILSGATSPDLLIQGPDGGDIILNVSGAPLRASDGAITGAIIIDRDVTERRRLELEAARQAALLEQAHEAMFVRTLNGTIVYWNQGATDLYGWTSADAVGQISHDLFQTRLAAAPEDHPTIVDALVAHTGIWTGELFHTTRAGARIIVASRQSLVNYGADERFVLETNRDITDRKQLEQEREAMLHSVAHELNTPLTSVKAQLQLMQRRAGRGEVVAPEQVGRVLSGVARMERLVRDLLDAARLETGHLTVTPERVSLRTLCQQAAEEQQAANERPITLALPAKDLFAEVDPERFVQVLTNLLSNALKYSPPATPVTLRLVRQGKQARISVTDQGPGIPQEAQAHLFERFYRVPDTVVQHGSGVGLGLGLFLVRRLVELQGGQVGVASTPGAGATFWVTLPLASVSASQTDRPTT